MKILLAMLSSEPSSRYENSPNGPYAVGIAYLHSVIKQEGHEVRMLYLGNDDDDTSEKCFFESFDTFKPDVVGFTIFSCSRVATFKTIEKLNLLSNAPHIIIGGIHTSEMYGQILRKYNRVVAVIGEGELTIVELLEALKFKRELRTVKGIAFFDNGQVIFTGHRDLIEDLDTIPFPHHEAFFDNTPERSTAYIFTTRGCPHKCTFCCNKIISRGTNRARSLQNVMDEITFLKGKYPRLKHIKINDDTFLLDNKRVMHFCEMLIAADLGITFGCLARVKPISSKMFQLMEKAGFTDIEFGLETGSKEMLKSIRKGITQEDVVKLINTLKPFNFNVHLLIMCGFPGENDSTVRESVSFIQSIQRKYYCFITTIGILQIFPGTEVYEIAKKAGAVNDDYWMTEKPVPIYTVDHNIQKLTEYENYILDRTSIWRVLTVKGFIHQFMKMPVPVIKHFLKHRELIPYVLGRTLKYYSPRIYDIAHNLFMKSLLSQR